MYGIARLQKVSGKTWRRLFTYGLPAVLILRYLLQAPGGTLIVLVGLYAYLYFFGDTAPWTPLQLLLWIDDLNGEVKASVLSSVVTVFGFLVAFQVAGKSWKIQALGQLKLKLGDELQAFFDEVADLATSMELFAKDMVKTAHKARVGGLNMNALPDVQRVVEKTPKFLEDRARFSAMSVSVHNLFGNNYSLLAASPNAIQDMQDAIDAMTQIASTNAMWSVVPLIPGVEGVVQAARVTDIDKVQAFVEICDLQSDRLVKSVAVIRGILMASVVEPNIHTFLAMFNQRKKIEQAFDQPKRPPPKNS